MWSLRPEHFKMIYTPLPPLHEQAAIVRFLDHVNRRIERTILAKRKVITLLNEQKQVIIHQAVTRGLNPNVRMKPSGIPWHGEIPEHWEVISVGAATSILQTGPFGSQLHSHEYITGGIPVINPSHMKDGRIIPDPTISVSQGKMKELERHSVRVGDIVVARRGELGRCAVVTSVEEGWLCGTGSLLIRCKLSTFEPAYFQLIFASQGIRDSLSLASIGATMDNLNAGMVARLRMPLPPIPEQHQIIKTIKTENRQHEMMTSSILREIDLLREYRTRLTTDVVTGKLDVREAARKLPKDDDEKVLAGDIDDISDPDDLENDLLRDAL
jgi:type I restriction enzyme S subunit